MTALDLHPYLLPHAEALVTRLETTNIAVGNHRNVLSSTGKITAPAIVLYLRSGGQISGSVGCPDTDAWLPFQLTCIGQVADQAMWVADQAHAALVSSPLTVPDRAIFRLKRTWFGASAERDEQVVPPLFYVPAEYRMWSTPSVEES